MTGPVGCPPSRSRCTPSGSGRPSCSARATIRSRWRCGKATCVPCPRRRPAVSDHGGPGHGLAARVRHVEALLERHGLVDATELDRALEAFLSRASPANGARVVARAWLDEGFRARLLADASAALPELGLSMGGGIQEQRLKVVANTETTHNVIVCTLCSCYPISLLGPSPAWYKSESYRSRVVRAPRGVLRAFAGTLGHSEAELAALVTRNGLIGVADV